MESNSGVDAVNEGCRLCMRKCEAKRKNGEKGFCGADGDLYIARAALHMWEEPPISGERGSGAIFFSNCPLKCVYCQNRHISSGGFGVAVTADRLCDIFFELRDKGAHNINLVSPTQYTEEIIYAIKKAKSSGFDLPFVWNTGGCETPETVERLSGLVDIYLTDFKYFSSELAKKYSAAADYRDAAVAALSEMVAQQPSPKFDGEIMTGGVIVRHLVLPSCTEDSKNVLRYLYKSYGDRIIISIMSQYTPPEELCGFPELSKKLSAAEYDEVVDFAVELGIENAFIQDGESASESFIPKFDTTGVLPFEK